jgi:hypothetical protein
MEPALAPGPTESWPALLDATDKQQDYQISRQGASCTAPCDGAGLRRARRGRGGDTYYTLLQALQAAEDFGPATLVDVDELPGDGLIMPCGGVGARWSAWRRSRRAMRRSVCGI